MLKTDADFGYHRGEDRKKVVLWSRMPWQEVMNVEPEEMPAGRLVHGFTHTPIGLLEVIGVCIPWNFAHVSTGDRNRKPWEEHCAFLRGLR